MTNGKKATKKSMKAAVQSPPTEDSLGPPAPSEESPLVQELRLQLQKTQSDLHEQVQINQGLEKKMEEDKETFTKTFSYTENVVKYLQDNLAGVIEEKEKLQRYIRKEKASAFSRQAEAAKAAVQKEFAEKDNTIKFLRGQLESAKVKTLSLQTENTRKAEELQQLVQHNERLQHDLRREQKILKKVQEEKKAMQIEMDQLKEACRLKVQAFEDDFTKQVNEAKTELQKLQANQTDLLKSNTDLHQALQKEQEVRQTLQAQMIKMESAYHQQRQATEEAEAKLAESLEAERATVKALKCQLDTERATFKAIVQKCTATCDSSKGEKEELAQNLEQLKSAHYNEEQKLQQRIQELSTALQRSEEEKTSVLHRSVELETSLRATEDRLQDTTTRMEDLQAITPKKRQWFNWFYW